MSCAFERLLSDYIDGELELREMARVRDHLDACPGCARAEAELRRTVQAVRSLPNDREPPDRVWAGIVSELDRPNRSPWVRRVSLAVGLAAAAATVWVAIPRPTTEQALLADAQREYAAAEAHYLNAISDLRRMAETERSHWRPEIASSYDDNLRTIEQAIARMRADAHAGTPAAMEHLLAAYQRQIDFLEDAIRSGGAGGRELEPL